MENEKLTKEFLEFLELYQSENYAEELYDALFYVSQEVIKHNLSDKVVRAIYDIRLYLNQLTNYLPESELENA